MLLLSSFVVISDCSFNLDGRIFNSFQAVLMLARSLFERHSETAISLAVCLTARRTHDVGRARKGEQPRLRHAEQPYAQ